MKIEPLVKPLPAILALLGLFIVLLGPRPGLSDDPPALTFNTSYSPPYSTPEAEGILDQVIREACRRAGIAPVAFQMMPAERCLQDARAGIADGVVARIEGMEQFYPTLVRVPEPTIPSRDFVAFSRHHRFPVDGWESLLPYNLGMVKGWKIFEANTAGAKSVVKLDSTRTLFQMLKADRIDLALNARLDGLATAESLGIDDVQVLEPPLASMRMYMYLHQRHRHFVEPIAAALKEMKADGSFSAITEAVLDRWIGPGHSPP